MKSITFILLVIFCINVNLLGSQDSTSNTGRAKLTIPEEIISRIPNDELTRFILARDRATDSIEIIPVNVYEEIGIAKEVLDRIPNDELFDFLSNKGYVKLEHHEHIKSNDNHGPPSARNVIAILFTIIGVIALLSVLSILLGHQRKTKDQNIVMQAIETGVEIPYDFLLGKSRNLNLKRGTLFVMAGFGIYLAGFFDVLPSSLSFIPFTIGIGFFMVAYLIKD